MQYFKTDLITKIILILLLINSVTSWIVPKKKEINLEAEIRLHDILQEREEMERQSNEKDSIINKLYNLHEDIKNDISIDTASISDLDSMFTDYINKRR